MGRRRPLTDWLRALGLVVLFAFWLAPLLFMLTNSFSTAKSFDYGSVRLIPRAWTLASYQRIFALKHLSRWVLNTLVVTGTTVVGGILLNGAAGYAFAASRARWAKALFWAFMAPLFVSGYVLIVAQFVVVGKLGLRNLAAVIIMGLYWPTGIYLFRNYFRSIPQGILDSAKMDGAGDFTTFFRIVLPLSGPIIGASLVMLCMGSVTSYIWPMLNLRAVEKQTYLVGLMSQTINVYAVKDVSFDLSVGVMVFVPYFIIFALSSRYFIGGLTGGALKE